MLADPAPGAEASAAVDERILVLAPTGQDARLLVTAIGDAGFSAEVAGSMANLAATIVAAAPNGPGAVLIAEESLSDAGLGELVVGLAQQPQWSDLPVLLITGGGVISPARARALESFGPAGTVTLIERPFRAMTLVSAISVALRSRRRQYQVRDYVTREREAAVALARKAAELEASNAELEQFAYVASHDLQEPLRMISSYLQIIAKRYGPQFDDKATTYFGYVTDGASRMSAMIKGILDYARVGNKRRPVEDTDSADALGNALKNLDQRIGSVGAKLEIAPLPRLRADPILLSQLFQNLISNALKFCDRPPVIRIAARREENEWIFTVADNGIGIPADSTHLLFRIFQRVHVGDKYRGTGIGLATCKKIVDLHGGRIWFESVEGEGSVFSFALPA